MAGKDSVERIFEVNGPEVELRGVARNVEVSKESTPQVVLRPLGTGVLHVDEDVGNDDAFLVIGTASPRADRSSVFVGWGGQFAQKHHRAATACPGD